MQLNSIQANSQQDKNFKRINGNGVQNAHFTGVGSFMLDNMGRFFQVCDDIPMIGVSFTDTVATNVPRTVVDLHQTGIPAAAETARREFSGLFVNCLIPGAFVYGAAKMANNGFMKDFTTPMGRPLNMSKSWANGEAIKNLVGVWQEYSGLSVDIGDLAGDKQKEALDSLKTKVFGGKGFIKSALGKIEGLNGVDNWEKLSDHKAIIDEAAAILEPVMTERGPKSTSIIKRFKYNRQKSQALQHAYDTIVKGEYSYKNKFGETITKVVDKNGGIKAAQNLKFDGKTIGSDLKNFLRDTVDIGEALSLSKEARINPNKFIKKATGLVNTKSLMGLAVVIPLAMSMQYINRAITRHKYNKSGAPIYKDFENENRVLTDDEKKKLNRTKPLAIGSIIGLAALSMGKSFPTSIKSAVDMLQFNTKFPTLNQCRVIATSTFASRMMASEDPNELRESTVRDLASFAGLYFLGDYAEKLAATAIQKLSKPGREGKLQMFNKTKRPEEYGNVIQKMVGWVKDTSIKSFDEIPKEYKNYRSLAKVGGLGFSIALLGVFLPMYNKHVTNKKEARRKAMLEQQKKQNNIYKPENIFPEKEKTVLKPEETTNPFEESKNNFKQWENYKSNAAFSKVASQFIK